eukprot:TRINITY_DN6926_c0_g1_i1.p3 TRINITY_DN6926_c0_g1~~TRINITY_DN6926_c0_g1_i1.p3  ORF type:complete len:74 (-),score=2.33 TRINITY_DN6926_c0_g1_i1:119-340(-)
MVEKIPPKYPLISSFGFPVNCEYSDEAAAKYFPCAVHSQPAPNPPIALPAMTKAVVIVLEICGNNKIMANGMI